MAEGEQVSWPELLVFRQRLVGPLVYEISEEPPGEFPEEMRYVPAEDASHFTQMVGGLEAEIERLRDGSSPYPWDSADRLQALLDQHKKEGRS